MIRRRLPERWRSAAREIGKIVVGVLIALGLGAVATEIGWRLEVRGARVAVRNELAYNFAGLDRVESQLACTDRRLEQIGAILAEASRTRRLPPLGDLGLPQTFSWLRGAWDSQVAADTAAHYPSAEAIGITRIYGRFTRIGEIETASVDAWATLQMMTGPGRPLSDVTEDALYRALAQARFNQSLLGFNAPFTRRISAEALGADYPRYADSKRPLAILKFRVCDPIAAYVPRTYGTAVLSPAEAAERRRAVTQAAPAR